MKKKALAMMYGPLCVESHEKELSGIIMACSSGVGLFVGVHFALLPLYLLTGSILN